jgi:hypothetical protein
LRRWPNVPKTQLALFTGGGALNAADRFIEALQKPGNFAKEHGPCRPERDRAARPGQELHTETLLKFLDRAAERGLRDAEALSCFREAEFLSHSLKIAKMAQIHGGNFNTDSA